MSGLGAGSGDPAGEPEGRHDGPGRLIGGRYRLVARLGSGGMATVWQARDEVVGRDCAVKEPRLPPDQDDSARERMYERLRREARAAATVEHPSAVVVHDVVVEGRLPYIVMELIRGESLHERLRRGPLPAPDAARIGLAIAGALGAAHAKGIVHRDVKPANVLLGPHDRMVLTDFGIARVQGEEPLTVSGEFVGSLEFIAPERMSGTPAGPAADLWSLGVLLYAAVEGWSPFRRTTLESTLAAILSAEPPEPVRAGPLRPLIGRLLAKDPCLRPGADEVLAELAEVTALRDTRERVTLRPPGPARQAVPRQGPGADLSGEGGGRHDPSAPGGREGEPPGGGGAAPGPGAPSAPGSVSAFEEGPSGSVSEPVTQSGSGPASERAEPSASGPASERAEPSMQASERAEPPVPDSVPTGPRSVRHGRGGRVLVPAAVLLALVVAVTVWLVADGAGRDAGRDAGAVRNSASAAHTTPPPMPTPDAWRWRPYTDSGIDAEIFVPLGYRPGPVHSDAELSEDRAITFAERGNPSWIGLRRADGETGTPVAWAGRKLTWLEDGGAQGGEFTAANARGTVVRTNLDGTDAALLDVTYDAQEGDTGRRVRRLALYVRTDEDERYTVLVEMPKGGREEAEGIDLFKGVRERVKLGKVATGSARTAMSR